LYNNKFNDTLLRWLKLYIIVLFRQNLEYFSNHFFQRELESPTPKRQRLSGSDVFDPMRPSPTLTPSPSRRRNRWDPNPETCLTPRSYHHRNSQFIHLPYHRRSPPHLRRSTRHRDKNGELTEVTC
jgi:hypothetical protein